MNRREGRGETLEWATVLGVALMCILLSPTPLVLDEETYLWISTQMSWGRPYDWQMPFPPFDKDGFIFAHPPLFLWWIKLFGNTVWAGLPWLLLWWSSILLLARKFGVSFFRLIALLLGCAGVLMPLTRTMMPDLMLSALGSMSMVLYFTSNGKAEERWKVLCAGFCLGMAIWTKYPALMLLVLPMILERETSKVGVFVLSALLIPVLGEGWLYAQYGEFHLWTVIEESHRVARGHFENRLIGLPMRLGVSLFPIAVLGLHTSKGKLLTILGVTLVLGAVTGFQWSNIGFMFLGMTCIFWLIKGDVWLRVWVGLVWLGIVVGHNYVSPRYGLLAAPPLAILVLQGLSVLNRSMNRHVVNGTIGISLAFSGVLLYLEAFHAGETERMLLEILQETDVRTFSGEWTFRKGMQQAGGQDFTEGDGIVLSATHAAGWTPSPEMGWQRVSVWESQSSPILLVDPKHSVGWYADTLGEAPLRFVWPPEPIERIELWKKP